MKISHVRYQIIGFLVFRFHSDDPGGRDLINLLTSGGQNIESMIISHVRYQIIDFFGIPIPFQNGYLLKLG